MDKRSVEEQISCPSNTRTNMDNQYSPCDKAEIFILRCKNEELRSRITELERNCENLRLSIGQVENARLAAERERDAALHHAEVNRLAYDGVLEVKCRQDGELIDLRRERDEAVKVIGQVKADVQGLVELDVLADSVYKIVQKWEATLETNK